MHAECGHDNGRPPRALLIITLALAAFFASAADPVTAADSSSPQGSSPAAQTAEPSNDQAHLYCPVCGAQNKPDSRFCLKDGTALPPIIPGRRAANFVRSEGTYSPEEIQQVMNRASESVVRIRARTTTTYRYPVTYWKDAEAEYFGSAMLGKIETSDIDKRLSGSGFAISADGEIVTNAHVASPDGLEADLTVETHDGRTFPASLIGVDAASDLALLKVNTDSIPTLDWGDSSQIRVGQETWAIGNPLDIGISIASGSISGISGMRLGMNQIEAFVHADAHITHGNSGGPLVNIYGQVLGVSDINFSDSKGQGYSIPSQMAELVIDRLRRDGNYRRGFIGLHVRPIDSKTLREFSLTRNDGTVVLSVLPGSPAESAGFEPGDVLYGINGRRAVSSYLIQEAVSSVGPGAAINLTLDRHGQELEIPVTTTQRPAAPHIDPLEELTSYLRIQFREERTKNKVFIVDAHRSRRAPGLYDGFLVKSVLPAQDWPEEPITLNYYKTRAKPVQIDSLDDLRTALGRAYLGGRIAVTFQIDYPPAPIASVAFDVVWPIIL